MDRNDSEGKYRGYEIRVVKFSSVHDQVSHYKLDWTSQAIFFPKETILSRPKCPKKVGIGLTENLKYYDRYF